jgi:alpha-ribazole phosphatase
MLSIIMMRHGRTEGNLIGRYNGRTDEPLCAEGIADAEAAPHDTAITRAYASPLLRTQQTAQICFPGARIQTLTDLCEMDFGDFEGRTANELKDDPDYRAWVAGGCVDVCPNGEGVRGFAKRAAAAFAGVVADAISRGEKRIALAVHGGVIMAVMAAFSGSDASYHTWYVLNCGGYEITIDERTWAENRKFTSYRLFGEQGKHRDMIGSEAGE